MANPLDVKRIHLEIKRYATMEGMLDEVDAIVDAWHRERPDLDVAPLQVLSRIGRLADVLDERRAEAFAEHGLQAHEFDVLTVLRRAGEPFELTAGELSALTHVTSGTMTSRLDRLAAAQARHPPRRPERRPAGPRPTHLVGPQAGRRGVRGAAGVRARAAGPARRRHARRTRACPARTAAGNRAGRLRARRGSGAFIPRRSPPAVRLNAEDCEGQGESSAQNRSPTTPRC